jgi:hypothetical protein
VHHRVYVLCNIANVVVWASIAGIGVWPAFLHLITAFSVLGGLRFPWRRSKHRDVGAAIGVRVRHCRS